MPTSCSSAPAGDDHLGVAPAHPVVGDHRRLDPGLDQQPQQAQRDVEHDLDVDPGVVRHPEPLRGDLGHVPPGAQLGVGVDPLQQRLEPPVAARRRASDPRRRRSPASRRRMLLARPAPGRRLSRLRRAVSRSRPECRHGWGQALRPRAKPVATPSQPGTKPRGVASPVAVSLACRSSVTTRSRSSPCGVPRSETRSRSSCGSSSPRRSTALSGDTERRLRGADRRRHRVLLRHGHGASSAATSSTADGWSRPAPLAFEAVGNCRRPIVAAVNGPAIAGGFALALLCDLRIASPSAVFGYPELPRGIPPSYAAARAVLPATIAQELCLTGRLVEGRGGPEAGDRPRGRRATSSPAGSSSRSGSPGCRARRSSRPSAGRCSSAATCGASCSRTSGEVFRRALLGPGRRAEQDGEAARQPLGDGETARRSGARRRSPRAPRRRGSGRERDRRPRWRRAGRPTRRAGWRSSTRRAARNSAVSSGIACGSTVSISTAGEMWSW